MKTQDNNSINPDTQSCQTAVSGSVFFKVMSGNSELEKFRTEQKANEVCEWYRKKGFPNAKVVQTDR